jgi:vancomycin resistance protein VanJ
LVVKVMSYNTWSENPDARRIAGVILAERPDLVLLQEIPEEVFVSLVYELRHLYGERALNVTYDRTIHQAVVSRYPLEPRANMKWKGQAQVVVMRSPAGAITVFNVHPLRTGGWRQRYRQIATLLKEDVLPVRSPVIFGGDLNVTENSQLYRLVTEHLQNAHDAAGLGFGFTYPAAVRIVALLPALPMARIDHVFFSDDFVAVRAGTLGHSGGSDHRPVIADVKLVASTPTKSSVEPRAHPREQEHPVDTRRETAEASRGRLGN